VPETGRLLLGCVRAWRTSEREVGQTSHFFWRQVADTEKRFISPFSVNSGKILGMKSFMDKGFKAFLSGLLLKDEEIRPVV
jgi:hypothetical protein